MTGRTGTHQHGNISELAGDAYIRNTTRYILGQLDGREGSALVVGSGDGSFERLLAERGSKLAVTSIDIDETFREALEKVSGTVIIGDFLTHRFDRVFDFIVCIDVIEHILDTDTFFMKARETLAPDGLCFIQTPNLASWHGRLSLLLGFTPEPMEVSDVKNWFGKLPFMRGDYSIHHVRVFTYRALREMAEFYGFEVVKAAGVDHRIPYLFGPFPGIAAQMCLVLRRRGET
jgi:SAM-dependent methyltransferase